MLNARNLKLSFGSRTILDDISISLLPKERLALVGENGTGKSSLLKIIAGEAPDAGLIELAKDKKIGFLQQKPELDEEQTVVSAVRSAMATHLDNIALHQKLCAELSHCPPAERDKLVKRIDALSLTIEQHGGFDVQHLVERVLSRLGVTARTQQIKTLSGGEKRRVDLARVLLMAPDIYLLDEPTNHLDIDAIRFLSETFAQSNAAILFISHDTAFIDEIATRITELSHGKLYTHEPPFANYLEKKLVRELIDSRSLHRRERLVVGELAWLRAGTPARTTKQNARIDRAYELIDQAAKDAKTQEKKRLDLEIQKSSRLGRTILELDSLGAAFAERILFNNFNLKVVPHQRYGILGRNGSGKSTFLSILSGALKPSFGAIKLGKNTTITQFDQQRKELDQEATLKETLADNGDFVVVNDRNIHIASYLEKYLFDSGDANRRVATLSGGEQNRLLLAKLFKKQANCLLLDEPTNDLDVESLAVLEETLLDYEGVVFIVSHDRRFLDRVATSIIAFEKNDDALGPESIITVSAGNYSDYQRLKTKIDNEKVKAVKEEKASIPAVAKKVKKRRSFKEQKELQAISTLIEQCEQEQTTLHAELADSELFRKKPQKVQEKIKRAEELEKEIERLYERWQELSDIEG